MGNKYVDLLQPKPFFNLKWYKGEDQYSEGDIEDVVMKIIAENEPENYSHAICEKFSWSSYYHLTCLRQNILNWYPFKEDADVLEVGCGMGAITGVLCDRCHSVTAVELSKRRATAALLRCREKENLEIIVGNLNDIDFEKKFDYITLIGVFEYQGSYTDSENPYHDFLCKIKSLLKPEGKLLIAIENQYGLKYWCGAREDHTGIPFDGINQYDFSSKKVRTFSKTTLESMVKACGFNNTFFYYPMPDYKLPTIVYSQEYLPKNENMLNVNYYYTPDNSTLVAQENKIYRDIIDNHVFEFFANSFLLECSEIGEVGDVIFASMSNRRQPEYQIVTRFRNNNKVEKYPLCLPEGQQHINQILENEINLENHGIKVWKSEQQKYVLSSPFCKSITVDEVLVGAYRNKDKDLYLGIWDKLYGEILKSSEIADWRENIMYSFYPDTVQDEEKYGVILKRGYVDMIPRNAFLIEGEFWWFDQEWLLENIPAKFVMYRAIIQMYYSFPELEEFVSLLEIATKYDLVVMWEELRNLSQLFEGAIIDADHFAASRRIGGVSTKACVDNINKLMA